MISTWNGPPGRPGSTNPAKACASPVSLPVSAAACKATMSGGTALGDRITRSGAGHRPRSQSLKSDPTMADAAGSR